MKTFGLVVLYAALIMMAFYGIDRFIDGTLHKEEVPASFFIKGFIGLSVWLGILMLYAHLADQPEENE